jgi:exonuclease SbcC
MRILKISGKNLASLAGQFTVDFEQEPLASSGLFAISGPTGAGKSTLLDALCLALYDATPRLLKVAGRGTALPDVGSETVSAQDTRTLLRRGSAEGHAEVDFVGNDGGSYRARWSVRRSRTKAEGALQPTAMSLHSLPSLQAIGGTKTEVKQEIERRIGLSFDQFTRAVLLAQNEFSTFLKTEDNERGELLETLTGRTIYSDISVRAFERAKREQAALQRLVERLADQKPLATEERTGLEARATVADAALAALEERKGALEQRLRWHQETLRLKQTAQQALHALQAAQDEVAAAQPRRDALRQFEAVQDARSLADNISRIDNDLALARAQLTACEQAAAEARQTQERLGEGLTSGAQVLQGAEDALRGAGPLLDQAKALDARIDTLLPTHRQALAAREQADRAHDEARKAVQALEEQQRSLKAAQEAGANWLQQHSPWQRLAQEWPRWDVLFNQAESLASQAGSVAQSAAASRQAVRTCSEQEAQANAGLAQATQATGALEERRQAAMAALNAIDSEALRQRRGQWEQRRESLAQGERRWTHLAERYAQHAALQSRQTALQQQLEAARSELLALEAGQGGLRATLDQAERSLKLAEAACGEHVETLRATLTDEEPCPVCGALEHPYRHSDSALHAMLAGLADEVAQRRREYDKHVSRLAAVRANAESSSARLHETERELASLSREIAELAPTWNAMADTLGAPAEEKRKAWFQDQMTQAQEALQEVQREETALRKTLAERDEAQRAYERAAATRTQLAEAAAAAQFQLARASSQLDAQEEKRVALNTQLDALLAELDTAFSGADAIDEDWKDAWRSAPASFHASRQAESRQWLAQRAAFDQRTAALDTLAAQLDAAAAALAKAGQEANAARGAYATLDASVNDMRARRQALWGGQPVAAVENGLRDAVTRAQKSLLAAQEASRQAGQQTARAEEAGAQALRRIAALQEESLAAAAALSSWLRHFAHAHSEMEALEPDQLHALLAVPLSVLREEREALHALEAAAAASATVLAERQAQLEQHRARVPPGEDIPPMPKEAETETGSHGDQAQHAGETSTEQSPTERLVAALDLLEKERRAALQESAGIRAALAEDDGKRQRASSMLAAIEEQEEIERRWARMNELIGSADGKKFRNYAQQFTLDVLLGYANAHLDQLARRYQLERIANTANPSLGLMVRDQDMGGELRSVHSLSGGESFLVSLALALGLASLSSNRVRVESLFIDEGFGSLDSETLRVAMDALDGLQSMGRKVGVISHVQEMTERISTRILVQPSAGGKSTVSVQ